MSMTDREVGSLAVRLVFWNIDGRTDPWHCLIAMDIDVALLQEADRPPDEPRRRFDIDPAPWATVGCSGWTRRTAIARLSDRVEVAWITPNAIEEARSGEFSVSRPGTVTAAHVSAPGIESFVAVSMYAMWESPHASSNSSWIVSDASAHHVVSDLSTFTGRQHGHQILAAGDLNILRGHGEDGSEYWAGRYGTVFDRLEALGLAFVGPQAPNGPQADPWPDELPSDSRNVPTFYPRGRGPITATRQLDFVFASRGMADSVRVRALNEPEQWGPSDHCRIEIEVS